MARVLIAGYGYLGSALGGELLQSGHTVFGLRRRETPVPGGVQLITADLTDPETLSHLPAGLDFVFYTVGSDARSDEGYRRAYVLGLRNLLAALSEARRDTRRIFFVSSTGVYGQRQGEWVDESSPTEPSRAQGRRLLETEALLRESPYPSSVVRFGGIYGPGRASLIERVRSGEATYPATYRQYQNRIHRDDCAGVLAYLMSHGEPASLYLGVDDEPTEKRVVLSWLADRLGAPPPRAVAEAVSDRGNKRCRNARLRRAGYRFRYPNFRAGYGALLGVDVDGLQK